MHNLFAFSIADNEISPGSSLSANLKTKTIFREKKLQFYSQIVTCDPSNYAMDYPIVFLKSRRKKINQWIKDMLITLPNNKVFNYLQKMNQQH